MNTFFEQLFQNPSYSTCQDDQMEAFQSTFQACDKLSAYNTATIEKLQFVCIEEDGQNALFTFPYSCIVARYCFFDPRWSIPERHELVVGRPSTLEGVQLLQHSSPSLEYVLYPYDQGEWLPLSCLISTMGTFIDASTLKQIYSDGGDEDDENDENGDEDGLRHTIKWTDELTLVLNHDEPITVLRNGVFFSGFYDEETHFQIGDGGTVVYTDCNHHLIVCQYGDVASVIIIKHVHV